MPRPRNWFWNASARRWEQKGLDGLVKAYSDETGMGSNRITVGTQATIQRAVIGAGSNLDYLLGFTGTSAAITSVTAAGVTVGTITNATGLAVADKVFGVPKSTGLSSANIGIGAFYVPTTNTLNVHFVNPAAGAGSLAAVGWDIIAVRSS